MDAPKLVYYTMICILIVSLINISASGMTISCYNVKDSKPYSRPMLIVNLVFAVILLLIAAYYIRDYRNS